MQYTESQNVQHYSLKNKWAEMAPTCTAPEKHWPALAESAGLLGRPGCRCVGRPPSLGSDNPLVPLLGTSFSFVLKTFLFQQLTEKKESASSFLIKMPQWDPVGLVPGMSKEQVLMQETSRTTRLCKFQPMEESRRAVFFFKSDFQYMKSTLPWGACNLWIGPLVSCGIVLKRMFDTIIQG